MSETPKKKKRGATPVFDRYLRPDESVLWWGKPSPYYLLTGADFFQIPFSFAWGGFAFFWMYQAINMEAPPFFALFGLPFVVMGAYMIVGRFIHQYLLRLNTYYAITDERVIILVRFLEEKITSQHAADVEIYSEQYSMGNVGTVKFEGFPKVGKSNGWMPFLSTPGFYQVDDLDDALETLRRVQDSFYEREANPPADKRSDELNQVWWDEDPRK